MASSSKFGVSSGSPDRPIYTSGQRGTHMAASLDRSSSLLESMENPIISSLPNMSRSTSTTPQGDLINFFRCLRFDLKSMVGDHKSNRLDIRRHLNVALGILSEESPSGSAKGKLQTSLLPEEIKRARSALRESSIKARERVKIFNEALSVFNKFFPSVPSKKRSRLEGFPSDRSPAVLSGDCSGIGSSLGKIGVQSYSVPSGFELEQQKSEERPKNSIPNKRTRTSMVDAKMDVRTNALVRSSGAVDRDREMLRLANAGPVQAEDRTLSVGVDGWEKSKMKKKRSAIKLDVSPNMVPTKPIDSYRETKHGMQQRPGADARSRLNNDSHGFRPGVTCGAVGVGRSDGISQQTGLGVRSSIPRTDPDNNSLVSDKRDRPIGSEKERVNHRVVNKANNHDDLNSSNPISNNKMNAVVRAPRSGSGVAPKLSPIFHRATGPNDWELSPCANKPPSAIGANNRKHMTSARSSSPPVAQWAGQRPQKISRSARRTNFVPIVSINNESPAVVSSSDAIGNDTGLGLGKRTLGSSPQQIKLKSEPLSSAALSESEESGAAEIKSRDKGKKPDDAEEKSGQNVQKISSLVLPTRKNKLVAGEGIGDGVRRQGRTGRGFTSTRSLMPVMAEKTGNVGTVKQLRNARLGYEKTESRAGRPPSRKLSDRKAYTRQKHVTINAAADFLDDGHEELLAAANATVDTGRAISSSFWRQMEPFFGFISDAMIAYLNQQGNLESALLTPDPVPSSVDAQNSLSNGFGLNDCQKNAASIPEQLIPIKGDHNVIPLCQRLIAALITEEDYRTGNEELQVDAYGPDFDQDEEFESNTLDNHSLINYQFPGHTAFNSYRIPGKPGHAEPVTDEMSTQNKLVNSNFSHSPNGIVPYQALMPNQSCSEFQYDNMQINEKLLLEIESIGLFPEPVPDITAVGNEEISKDINKLEEKSHEQVSKRKGFLDRLLKSASEAKELQEKDFEEHALDKLVTMAYQKYMTSTGSNATGGKSSSNKIAKQAASAFVKRTLERYRSYEYSGHSCFSEPLFRDIFTSGYCKQSESTTKGESSKTYASFHYFEGRLSASMCSQQSPLQFVQNVDNHDIFSSDVFMPANNSSEQINGKEDMWSSRVKKRELSLDDLGGIAGPSSYPSGMGSSLVNSPKGKRSERDRDGKGQNREALTRNGSAKICRPALTNVKGERKSKTKPKQKTTQLSVSVNGLLGKMSEQPKSSLPTISKSSKMTTNSHVKEKDESGFDGMDDHESLDLSHLQLPGMDVLGVPDDLGGQGQDLGSWLNIDDDGLLDDDFMGLEIPMDDLSDLNINMNMV